MPASANRTAMIGREADMRRLRALLDETAARVPRAVVIGGEAGIGKTTLLREFTASAGPEALLLSGQCVDLGTVAPPYAPIVGILRALISAVGVGEVREIVGPGVAALAALMPELAASPEPAPSSGPSDPSSINHLHEAVAVLLEACSRERSIMIVIEDLHWVDGATLDLLRFLLRALGSGRLFFLLSYRSDDVSRGHPLRGFLTELERARLVTRWQLTRLTKAQVRTQAKRILGEVPSAELLDSIFERSEGVPFFVEELLGLGTSPGREELPDTLREILLARYEVLSEPAQRLLRVISAGGVRVSHPLLEEVVGAEGFDAALLDEAAREAVLATVVVADDTSYAFRHALVREAIHSELLPGERGRFHTRYAEALERGVQPGRVAAVISYHWMIARDSARAFSASIMAMSEARAAYAYATAGQMGERALELWDQVPDAERHAGTTKVELLRRTAAALRSAGDSERAFAFAKQALAECPPEDRVQRARLLRDKSNYLVSLGRPGTVEILTEALSLVPEGDESELRATIMVALAGRHMIEGRLRESFELADAAYDEAIRVGSLREQSIAANIGGNARLHDGQIEAGIARIAEAGELAVGRPDAELRYHVNASDAYFLLGRFSDAVRIAHDGRARARALGVDRSSGVVLASNSVDPLLALGEWEEAGALIEKSLALDPPLAFRRYLQRARMWLMLWRGDADGAASTLDGLRPVLADIISAEMQSRLGMARLAAEIANAQRRFADAWREASVILTPSARPLPGYDLPLIAVAARTLRALLDAPEQQAMLDPGLLPLDGAEEKLRVLGEGAASWPSAPVWGSLFEAELSPEARMWQAAVAASDSPLAPVYLRSYTRMRLGEAQLAAGDRAGAKTTLTEAAALAADIGIGLVGAEIAAVLASAGLETSTGSTAANPAVLTAREDQVLELLAQGLSNRQIGEQLFISAKTASVHVSAILRKLGASTRTEAAFIASAVPTSGRP